MGVAANRILLETVRGQMINRGQSLGNDQIYDFTLENKYECTKDHELTDAAAYCIGACRCFVFLHDVMEAILSVSPNRKSVSVSRCLSTGETFLSNFIPIRFETTELQACFDEITATTRRVAIWLCEISSWSKTHTFVKSVSTSYRRCNSQTS